MNIILMGYRCSGKTTTGRALARITGLPFYDTDEEVTRRRGRTIAEMVAEAGWSAFRAAEKEVVGELAAGDGAVIALGGGAVLDGENVRRLKERGFFVWLTASAAEIERRLTADAASRAGRPPLSGSSSAAEARVVLAEREPLYRGLADLVVDTTEKDAIQAARIIAAALGKPPLRTEDRKGGRP